MALLFRSSTWRNDSQVWYILHAIQAYKVLRLAVVVIFIPPVSPIAAFYTYRLLERGKSSGRSDDNSEVIEKRLLTYEEQTRPVIEKFKALGLVRTVDANRSIDEVYGDVSLLFAWDEM